MKSEKQEIIEMLRSKPVTYLKAMFLHAYSQLEIMEVNKLTSLGGYTKAQIACNYNLIIDELNRRGIQILEFAY